METPTIIKPVLGDHNLENSRNDDGLPKTEFSQNYIRPPQEVIWEFLDNKSPKTTKLLLTRHDDEIPETEYELDLPHFEDAVSWVRRYEDSTGFDFTQAGHHRKKFNIGYTCRIASCKSVIKIKSGRIKNRAIVFKYFHNHSPTNFIVTRHIDRIVYPMIAQGFAPDFILRTVARTTFFGIPAFKGHIPRPMLRKLDIEAITTPNFLPFLQAFVVNSRRGYQKHEYFQAKSLPKAPFNYKLKRFMEEFHKARAQEPLVASTTSTNIVKWNGMDECSFKTIELDEAGNLKGGISKNVTKSKRVFVADLETKEEASRWVQNWENYSQFDFIRCIEDNFDSRVIDKFICSLKSCSSFIVFMKRKTANFNFSELQHMKKSALIVVSSNHDHSMQRISRLRKKFLYDRFSGGYGPHRAYYHWVWHNASNLKSLEDIMSPPVTGPICSMSVPNYLYHQWRENNNQIAPLLTSKNKL